MTDTIKVPSGYVEQSSEIVGFWDSDNGAIHMIPRFVRLFDSNLDNRKTSTLLVADLVDPCEVTTTDGESVQAAKGQKVGIWTKPGMAVIKELGGVPVYMYQDGEKDTGKSNPMKLFRVMSKTRGQKLPVQADFRKFSLPQAVERSQNSHPDMAASDNIPF